MGANPYCYFVPYQTNIQAVLDQLRDSEFAAGRYEPCFQSRTNKYLFEFGLTPRDTFPAPGACHGSLEEAYEAVDENGTSSILDIEHAIDAPFETVDGPSAAEEDRERYFATAPMTDGDLLRFAPVASALGMGLAGV